MEGQNNGNNVDFEKLRWRSLDKLLLRDCPHTHATLKDLVEKGEAESVRTFLQEKMKVLIIGAGGLGCDLLKNLAMSGFRSIDIIDMDQIDTSNLNRQFLFRDKDVGKHKAQTAAEFVNARVDKVNVTAHNCKIQDKDLSFYQGFNLIIAGLDSVKARRWINSTLITLAEEYQTIIPFIDGGTEGFKGQARVIIPTKNACFECTMNLFTKTETFAMCTLANTPRMPEHCIEYALVKLWDENKEKEDISSDEKVDGDNPKHIKWIYEAALKRAKEYGIRGVTYRLTQGVVKNIIPAIASTNAIIASSCTNEALKVATAMADTMKYYMTYSGGEGIYTYTYEPEKDPNCAMCAPDPPAVVHSVNPNWTLENLRDVLRQKHQLSEPAVMYYDDDDNKVDVYLTKPIDSEKKLRPNLEKKLLELFQEGTELTILDGQVLQKPMYIELKFDDSMDMSDD